MNKILFILFIVFSNSSFFAQLTTIYGKADYPFWQYLPEDTILNNKPPLIIFLHGKSLSGTDINKVKKYGVIHEIEKGRKIPAIVLAPQVASGHWVSEKVLSILDYAKKNLNIDTTRIYVVGMSLGGYGTLHFAGKYADKITAAVALCGGGNTKDACNLSTIPLWIQHGDKDFAVPISESEKMVEAIKACNGEQLIYTIVSGADHGALERVFRSDELYDWLFQQRKGKK
jgi:predicted peptidase